MGMYSRILEVNIKIINEEKYKEVLASGITPYTKLDFDFYEFDDCKLHGYYFDDDKKFFDAIAPYVEGEIIGSYESEFIFRIVFQDGKWFVQEKPKYDWSECDRSYYGRN